MYKEQPSDGTGLAALYTFKSSDISKATNGKVDPCTWDRRLYAAVLRACSDIPAELEHAAIDARGAA